MTLVTCKRTFSRFPRCLVFMKLTYSSEKNLDQLRESYGMIICGLYVRAILNLIINEKQQIFPPNYLNLHNKSNNTVYFKDFKEFVSYILICLRINMNNILMNLQINQFIKEVL